VRLEFADHTIATVSRVFLFLYTGDYSDIFYPVLGRKRQDSLCPPHSNDALLLDADGPTTIAAKNLEVYLCAKTLAIKSLQTFAITKLDNYCRNEVMSPNFPATLSYILDRTTSEDLELRTTLVYICLENSAFAARGADIETLLVQHEPVAWNLGRKVLMKSLELLPLEKVSESKKQADADADDLKAECKQLRIELKSVATALVQYQPPQPLERPELLRLRNEVTPLRAQNARMHLATRQLARANLELEAKLEKGKAGNNQHLSDNKRSSLEAQLQDAESKLRSANSARFAWGAMQRKNQGLRSDVTTLKNALEEAERRMKDCKSCRVCRREFFGLLKMDLPKGDIWVKCRSCGGNHR
jgi:hypothetical protein